MLLLPAWYREPASLIRSPGCGFPAGPDLRRMTTGFGSAGPDGSDYAERPVLDRILDSIAKNPSIGVVGISSWDTVLSVRSMPRPGDTAIVGTRTELPGGSAANAAVAAARLGARVELFSSIGDDAPGVLLAEHLVAAGVGIAQTRIEPGQPTARATRIVSHEPPGRTVFESPGAAPKLGDRFDIDRLFSRHLVLLDSADPALRRFLIDLPVHTYPDVKILAPMTGVVEHPGRDEFDSVIRCDALVGTEDELLALTENDSLDEAIRTMQDHMRVSNLRTVAITRGADGAMAFDARQVFGVAALDVEIHDATGAEAAFAGALAVGLAVRLSLLDTLVLANCVAGLSTQALGAQAAIPSPVGVEIALRRYLDRVRL